MSRLQNHGRGHSGFEGLLPSGCAEAPSIPGFQSRKSPLGHGRGQVIARRLGERKECFRHGDADGVGALIFRPSIAAPGPVEAREGFHRAWGQGPPEDISLILVLNVLDHD